MRMVIHRILVRIFFFFSVIKLNNRNIKKYLKFLKLPGKIQTFWFGLALVGVRYTINTYDLD